MNPEPTIDPRTARLVHATADHIESAVRPEPRPPHRRAFHRRCERNERAQSTVEYALILLGAAAIALMVVAWVTGSDAIGQLFETVMGRILQQAG